MKYIGIFYKAINKYSGNMNRITSHLLGMYKIIFQVYTCILKEKDQQVNDMNKSDCL